METYSPFRPTGYDRHIYLADREDWLVAPVSRTRDSDTLAESNFAVVLADLGDEGDNVESHRFGHWGPGWYEIILVRPGTPEASRAEWWEGRLDGYPVANEEDWSDREYDAATEAWSHMGISQRIEACARYDVSIFAARRDEIPSDPRGEMVSYLADGH
jgi:hypothetical protein